MFAFARARARSCSSHTSCHMYRCNCAFVVSLYVSHLRARICKIMHKSFCTLHSTSTVCVWVSCVCIGHSSCDGKLCTNNTISCPLLYFCWHTDSHSLQLIAQTLHCVPYEFRLDLPVAEEEEKHSNHHVDSSSDVIHSIQMCCACANRAILLAEIKLHGETRQPQFGERNQWNARRVWS